MSYINDNVPNDELTEEIEQKIQVARHDGQLYSSYIKEQQNTMLAEERGRAKGLAEGEAKGLFKAIIMLKNIGATVDTIINSLMTQYSMSEDEATKKVNEVLSQS